MPGACLGSLSPRPPLPGPSPRLCRAELPRDIHTRWSTAFLPDGQDQIQEWSVHVLADKIGVHVWTVLVAGEEAWGFPLAPGELVAQVQSGKLVPNREMVLGNAARLGEQAGASASLWELQALP